MFIKKIIYLILIFLFFSLEAKAYIGPGISGGFLLLIIGFLLTIFIALFAIIYYPIKNLMAKLKKTKKKTNDQ